MIKLITATSIAMMVLAAQTNSAFACNKINGCVYDNMYENYDMMHSGGMAAAIEAGRENVEAFRALTNGGQAAPRPAPSHGHKRSK